MRAYLIPALFLSTAVQAAEDVPYQPDGFLRTGYSDKQLAPDSWRVKGSAHAIGGGVAVALYHAAELAMAARADEIRVTSQKVKSQTLMRRDHYPISFTETATIIVRAVRTDADRTACEEKDARQCLTLPVAGVLARFGARLGRPTARPGEATARPVALVTYDRRQGGPAPWQIEAARHWPEPVAIPVHETPGLALLLGRLVASSSGGRSSVPVPASMPAPAPAPLVSTAMARPPFAPVSEGVRPAMPAAPRLSAAEVEQARLRAAAPTNGDRHQGWTTTP